MVKRPTSVDTAVREPEVSDIPKLTNKPGTALINWEEELAREAKAAAEIEKNVGGGSWFSTRAGQLTLNDIAVQGNQLVAIVVSHIIENSYFDEAFDPDRITPPKCFALGIDEHLMAPHESVLALDQQEHPTCKGCPQNAYKTAVRQDGRRGKGKACGNRRRLAVLNVGSIDQTGNRFELFRDDNGDIEEDHYKSAPIVGLKIPPTSLKGWASYVSQLSLTVGRPPWAVFTKIQMVPDAGSQFKVVFSPITQVGTTSNFVPNELLPIVKARIEEARALIETPFNLDRSDDEPEEPAPKVTRGKVAAAPKRSKY